MDKKEQLRINLKAEFESFIIPEKEFSNGIITQIDKVIWSTEPQVHLELLKIERSGIPKGRILKKEPSKKACCIKTCFDKNEQPIYEEEWGSHPSHGYKKYFSYSENLLSTYKFNRNGDLEEIEFLEQRNGVPYLYGCYAEHKANTFDEYEFQNDTLVSIKSMRVYDSTVQNPTYFPQFDSFGNLSLLKRVDEPSSFFPNGQNIIIYEKHNYTIKALTDILIKEYTSNLIEELKGQENKNAILLTVENAFSSDGWMPPRFYFLNLDVSIKENQIIDDWLNISELNFNTHNEVNQKIRDASRLLEQEIVHNEKFDLPNQILFKIAKSLYSKFSQLETLQNVLIVPLDLPDDYGTEVVQILKRVYKAKEIRALKNANNG